MLLLIFLTCFAGVNSAVTEAELSRVMQTLWNADSNRFVIGRELVLNLQSRTNGYSDTDRAYSKLFSSVPNLSKKSTYKKFIALLDNYEPLTHIHDKSSIAEQSEQSTFINSIMGTTVWQEVRRFLTEKGYVSTSRELRQEIQRIWFTDYSRTKGITGSSGFEHIFVGELSQEKGEISGLHNWVAAYQREAALLINYQGYLDTEVENNLYEVKFKWGNYSKFGSSMFIGTSPEFEMAVYTVCFLTRRNQKCEFTMNGRRLIVQTYSSYNGAIATAYPNF